MNYFTRERYLAMQKPGDEAMDASDAAWAEASAQYGVYLQTIRPEIPDSLRELLDGFYLHDARVLGMGRRSETYVICVQLDAPPNELLTITYDLAAAPELKEALFPWANAATNPLWLEEEIELIRATGKRHFIHSILFSNGWELRLPLRDVHLATIYPTFPYPRTLSSTAQTSAAQPA